MMKAYNFENKNTKSLLVHWRYILCFCYILALFGAFCMMVSYFSGLQALFHGESLVSRWRIVVLLLSFLKISLYPIWVRCSAILLTHILRMFPEWDVTNLGTMSLHRFPVTVSVFHFHLRRIIVQWLMNYLFHKI